MFRKIIFGIVTSLILTAGNSWACSRAPSERGETPERDFSDADAVIVGHLIKVEEVRPPSPEKADPGLIEGTFRLIERLKGEVPADNKVRSQTFLPGNCTIPLLAGSDYIFYLNRLYSQSALFVRHHEPPKGGVVIQSPGKIGRIGCSGLPRPYGPRNDVNLFKKL